MSADAVPPGRDRRAPAYAIHGLVVVSEVPLHAPPAPPDASSDLVVEIAPLDVERRATSPVILAYRYPDGSTVTVTEEPAGYLADHSGLVSFLISTDLRSVRMWAQGERGWAIAGALLEGWALAFVLQMAGSCVLHASAVVTRGGAIALLGNSGMGKSTLAALLCGEGAGLLADDVLRVDHGPDGPIAFPGSVAVRLRPAACGVVDHVRGASSTPTPDGRLSLAFDGDVDAGPPLPLRAVLVPWPSRAAQSVAVNWLEPQLAVVELSAYPRLYDWQVVGPTRVQFAWAAQAASTVPVGHLVVPWGPPWRTDVVAAILGLVRERSCGGRR